MPFDRKVNMAKMIVLPRTLAAEIADWRDRNRVRNQSEAIRVLVRSGLDVARQTQELKQKMSD